MTVVIVLMMTSPPPMMMPRLHPVAVVAVGPMVVAAVVVVGVHPWSSPFSLTTFEEVPPTIIVSLRERQQNWLVSSDF